MPEWDRQGYEEFLVSARDDVRAMVEQSRDKARDGLGALFDDIFGDALALDALPPYDALDETIAKKRGEIGVAILALLATLLYLAQRRAVGHVVNTAKAGKVDVNLDDVSEASFGVADLLAPAAAAVMAERFYETIRKIIDRMKALAATTDDLSKLRRMIERDKAINRLKRELLKRASVIGATETMRAYNLVNHAALTELGRQDRRIKKTWVSMLLPTTRPAHRDVHGTCINCDEDFIVGGYPAFGPYDPRLPPSQVVNCVCTLALSASAEDLPWMMPGAKGVFSEAVAKTLKNGLYPTRLVK